MSRPAPSLFPIPRKPRPADQRTSQAKEADAAIAELRSAIEPALRGITWNEWIKRNRRYVVDMIASGLSREEVVTAHYQLSIQRRTPIVVMKWLQDWISTRPPEREMNVIAAPPRPR